MRIYVSRFTPTIIEKALLIVNNVIKICQVKIKKIYLYSIPMDLHRLNFFCENAKNNYLNFLDFHYPIFQDLSIFLFSYVSMSDLLFLRL